jgi:hypothetical protein
MATVFCARDLKHDRSAPRQVRELTESLLTAGTGLNPPRLLPAPWTRPVGRIQRGPRMR